jgi:hypothetical protein
MENDDGDHYHFIDQFIEIGFKDRMEELLVRQDDNALIDQASSILTNYFNDSEYDYFDSFSEEL